jgi:hypothetical protein
MGFAARDFVDFSPRDWLRIFGVIRDRRARGKRKNRAERLFITENFLPCPMP